MPDINDLYDLDEIMIFDVPESSQSYYNILAWFIGDNPAFDMDLKFSADRIYAFMINNGWAVTNIVLRNSLAQVVEQHVGLNARIAFLVRWDSTILKINEVGDTSPVLSSFHLTAPISPTEGDYDDFDGNSAVDFENALGELSCDESIKLDQAFVHSPHMLLLKAAFSTDKILIFQGAAMLQSELDADTPCSYKSQGYSHCHNVECRLTVNYWTNPGAQVLDVIGGKVTAIEALDAQHWMAKHMHDTENICKETLGGYNCECGTLSSNGLIKKLFPIIDYKCINCYLMSIRKCGLCAATVSTLYTGSSLSIDGDYHIICKGCISSLKQCSSCGRHFKTKPLFNGYCMGCAPSVVLDYNHKPSAVFYDNSGDNVFMGIEVEVEMKEGLQQYSTIVANRFQEAAGPFVYLKKDSSISKEGFEIVTHPASISHWKGNSTFWNAIRKLTKTCEAWSVDNCGMHVHINRDAFINNAHMAKFMLFINNNRLLSAFVAERYNAKQAPFIDMDLDTAKSIVSFDQKINRHCAVNVQHNIPTVEVRIFKGNLKKQRMLKNIEFVHSVFSFTQNGTPLEVEPYIEYVVTNNAQYPNLCAYISKYKRKL